MTFWKMHRRRPRLFIISILLIGGVVCSIYLKPDFTERPDNLHSAWVLFPILLYVYNPWLLILTLLIAILLQVLWILSQGTFHEIETVLGVPFVICSLLFSCVACASATDREFDFVGEDRLLVSLIPQQRLQVGNHAYYLTLEELSGSPSNGPFRAIIFECGRIGLICRAVYTKSWGMEANGTFHAFDLVLREMPNGLNLSYHSDIWFQYQVPANPN